jgi:site-specific recombinase
MKVEDLKVALQYAKDSDEVTIAIALPYSTAGAIPMVSVKSAMSGFDWESGRFIIRPIESLTPEDRDFAKQFKELQKKAGWLDYENRGLKAQNKKLRAMYGVEE